MTTRLQQLQSLSSCTHLGVVKHALERDKEAALNRPAQANERLCAAEEAREREKKLPSGSERDALPSVRHSGASRR